MRTTTSEVARHVRAELETIASGLRLRELARLLEVGRRLLEEQDGELRLPSDAAQSGAFVAFR